LWCTYVGEQPGSRLRHVDKGAQLSAFPVLAFLVFLVFLAFVALALADAEISEGPNPAGRSDQLRLVIQEATVADTKLTEFSILKALAWGLG
jgi:hypothetical protein